MKQRGFSLIELSIVLVIIALIAAAIVGGRSLLQQSETQSVIREVNSIMTAINAFRARYDALPGDFAGGAQYWGTTFTWDGSNSDGVYNWQNESQAAWWHMAQADLFSRSLLVVPHTDGGGGILMEPGYNILGGRVDGSGYWITTNSVQNTASGGISENVIKFAVFPKDTNEHGGDGALVSKDARSVDLKMDDGFAGSGKVKAVSKGAQFTASQGCATTTSNSFGAPVYRLDDAVGKCIMYFSIR